MPAPDPHHQHATSVGRHPSRAAPRVADAATCGLRFPGEAAPRVVLVTPDESVALIERCATRWRPVGAATGRTLARGECVWITDDTGAGWPGRVRRRCLVRGAIVEELPGPAPDR